MSYYFWILLGTIAFPFLLSFDKRVHFYTRWKYLFPVLLLIGAGFIVWDRYFTLKGVWGFNPEYLQGIEVFYLPLEEVLFFFIVPYACLFLYEVFRSYFPDFKGDLLGRSVAFMLVLSGLILTIVYIRQWYTLTACASCSLLVLGIHFRAKKKWFNHFALMYLVCTIPFLIVNGALTGFFTDNPVVWYEARHISGFHVGTIPIEDFYYNCTLLLGVTSLYEQIKQRA